MSSSNMSFGLTKVLGRLILLLVGVAVVFGVYIFIFHDGMVGTEFLSDEKIKEKVEEALYQEYTIRNPGLVQTKKEIYTSCFDPSAMTCNVEREAFNVYVYTFTGVGLENKTITVTYRNPYLRHLMPNEEELKVEYPSKRKQ